MTDTLFDQNAWLKRIGYNGPLEPTLGVLHDLIFTHAHSIAYELLDSCWGGRQSWTWRALNAR